MDEKQKEKFNRLISFSENVWEKRSGVICLAIGLICGAMHFFGMLVNFRFVTANVVNFASIVIGITGVFLTLLITLKESIVFQRLKEFFPTLHKKLYLHLRHQIYYSLIVVVLSLLINALPESPSKYLSSLGVAIWFFFFWKMSFGAFFTVKIVTDLVLRNTEVSGRNVRK